MALTGADLHSRTIDTTDFFSEHLVLVAKRIDNPTLNDHAKGIGYLCFLYNGLETRINNLIGLLAKLPDEDLEIFCNQIDLLKKLPILKALAFKNHSSKLWYSDVKLMIWVVETHIIPPRNRYVHDIWLSLPSGAIRRHERTRISKPQSWQEAQLTTHEHIPTSADQIWELVQHTKDVSNIFRHLYTAHKSGRAKTSPEEVIPQRYRDHWNARRKPPKEALAK